jgi:hypothetical protein
MAFKDFLVPVRDDQFGKLGREKPFQPPDTAQFIVCLSVKGRDPGLTGLSGCRGRE